MTSRKGALEKADAFLKKLSGLMPRFIREPIERLRHDIDPIRERDATIAKQKARIARLESQVETLDGELQRERSELLAVRIRISEVEEAAAKSQKEAFDTALNQSERELSANQECAVLTREVQSLLSHIGAQLKLLGEEARGRKETEGFVKELESVQYGLGKTQDLVNNIRFFLKDE